MYNKHTAIKSEDNDFGPFDYTELCFNSGDNSTCK